MEWPHQQEQILHWYILTVIPPPNFISDRVIARITLIMYLNELPSNKDDSFPNDQGISQINLYPLFTF
jgi:hypothetical protein